MNTKKQEVGTRIRETRKAQKLSQFELAELLNISPTHMSDIENGKTNIGLDIFMRITEILQVSADWLLQTDTPAVNVLLLREASSLLSDCSSDEMQALLKIMKEIKSVLLQTGRNHFFDNHE